MFQMASYKTISWYHQLFCLALKKDMFHHHVLPNCCWYHHVMSICCWYRQWFDPLLQVRFLGGDAYVPRLVAASVTRRHQNPWVVFFLRYQKNYMSYAKRIWLEHVVIFVGSVLPIFGAKNVIQGAHRQALHDRRAHGDLWLCWALAGHHWRSYFKNKKNIQNPRKCCRMFINCHNFEPNFMHRRSENAIWSVQHLFQMATTMKCFNQRSGQETRLLEAKLFRLMAFKIG